MYRSVLIKGISHTQPLDKFKQLFRACFSFDGMSGLAEIYHLWRGAYLANPCVFANKQRCFNLSLPGILQTGPVQYTIAYNSVDHRFPEMSEGR